MLLLVVVLCCLLHVGVRVVVHAVLLFVVCGLVIVVCRLFGSFVVVRCWSFVYCGLFVVCCCLRCVVRSL